MGVLPLSPPLLELFFLGVTRVPAVWAPFFPEDFFGETSMATSDTDIFAVSSVSGTVFTLLSLSGLLLGSMFLGIFDL